MQANFEIWDHERGLLVSVDTNIDKVYINLLAIGESDNEERHPIKSYIINGASEQTIDPIDSSGRFMQFFARYNKKELIKFFETIVDFLRKNTAEVNKEE